MNIQPNPAARTSPWPSLSASFRATSGVALAWLSLAATGWAQRGQQIVEEEPEKTYVPSYMIIVFFVGFALLMICRSGKRQTGFRRDD